MGGPIDFGASLEAMSVASFSVNHALLGALRDLGVIPATAMETLRRNAEQGCREHPNAEAADQALKAVQIMFDLVARDRGPT